MPPLQPEALDRVTLALSHVLGASPKSTYIALGVIKSIHLMRRPWCLSLTRIRPIPFADLRRG
jgi:hypothetical protein